MPLSVTTSRSAGIRSSRSSVVSSRVSNVSQVAVVDADQRRLELQRTLELALIVHLDEHGKPELLRNAFEIFHARRLERRGDEQDAVGAGRARFVHLIGVDHEILAQHRQRARRARRAQVVEAPWKNCASVSTDRHAAPWRA